MLMSSAIPDGTHVGQSMREASRARHAIITSFVPIPMMILPALIIPDAPARFRRLCLGHQETLFFRGSPAPRTGLTRRPYLFRAPRVAPHSGLPRPQAKPGDGMTLRLPRPRLSAHLRRRRQLRLSPLHLKRRHARQLINVERIFYDGREAFSAISPGDDVQTRLISPRSPRRLLELYRRRRQSADMSRLIAFPIPLKFAATARRC